MRIGQFTDSFWPVVDGVGRVVYSYAETLSGMGHAVTTIATRTGRERPGSRDFVYLNYRGIPIPRAKPYMMGLPHLDIQYMRAVRPLRFDIVHAHSPFQAGMEAVRMAKKMRIPLVGTFHSKFYDDFYKVTGSKAAADLARKWVVWYYNRCDEVWAVNAGTARVLNDYGYAGDVRVMPNGVIVRALDAGAVQAACQKWRIRDGVPMLMFVGQLNWKKNLRSVLEACAHMKRAGAPFQLIIAGQGPDEHAVDEVVRALNLEDAVTRTGHITDMRLLDGLYARCDLFVFPSLYDNAPMVVREAAAMGTPSLLVRGSDAADVIEDGVNGFLCENSVSDIRRVIEAALAHPKLPEIGLRAKETIPIEWPAIIESAVERYEALIDKKRARQAYMSAL